MPGDHLFFSLASDAAPAAGEIVPPGYTVELWQPGPTSTRAQGLPVLPFVVWFGFHYLRTFANQDYGILILRHEGRIAHRSCIFPGYFRFPFMQPGDLQIGDTWTHEAHRGRGLAVFALKQAVVMCRKSGRTFWYLCEPENTASIRVAEKAHFKRYGVGTRKKRWGLRLLGAFELNRATEGL